MGKQRVARLQRQWTLQEGRLNLSNAAAQGVVLQADPQDTLNSQARLLRVLVNVSVAFDALITTGIGYAGVGLLRADADLSLSACNPCFNAEANRRWLYRQLYMCPQTALGSGTFQGDLAMALPGQPYNLDWQVFSGRGVTLNKDEVMALTFSVVTQGFDNCYFAYTVLSLWEA